MNWKNLGLKILVICLFAVADTVTELGLPLWICPFLYWLGEFVKEKGGLKQAVGAIFK